MYLFFSLLCPHTCYTAISSNRYGNVDSYSDCSSLRVFFLASQGSTSLSGCVCAGGSCFDVFDEKEILLNFTVFLDHTHLPQLLYPLIHDTNIVLWKEHV